MKLTLKLFPLLLAMLSVVMVSCSSADAHQESIMWETLGNQMTDDEDFYIQRFTVDANAPFEQMAFCMFKREMSPVAETDTLIEILPGYFAIKSDRFTQAGNGEPIEIDIKVIGSLRNASYAPDGMHLVRDGKAVKVENVFLPITERPEQYVFRRRGEVINPMVYGPEAYVINDSLRSVYRPTSYGEIPTLKFVALTDGTVACPDLSKAKVEKIADARQDYFRININSSNPEEITLYTNSEYPQAILTQLQHRLNNAKDAEGNVPTAEIEDWADYGYRAFMLDVVRNFTPIEGVRSIMDLMADYGLNVLHFHVGDDEGWRVEIPELPELTAVGSKRGYTMEDNVPFLKQIYSGDGNPESTDTPANGYYTQQEFIDLLKYAKERGIDVIPEFDTPGHSRAAIRAMEYRAQTTGDDSYRLIEDGDTSVYTSAQAYHDNILNPALEGPYKFWDTVMASMIDAYSQAGANLRAIHIGGDEVPAHAWDGSESVQALMKEKGMTNQSEVHAYFVEKVAQLAKKHNVKIAGWQEVALGHSPEYDKTVQPQVEAVNCWTRASSYGPEMVQRGYPMILSNVDYLYFDQTPTTHPEEPGLTWGGLVDEFKPLHATIDVLCPTSKEVQSKVKGVSAQLFAETVRSQEMVERYILPRILGLAERAHNAHPTLTDQEYFGILTAEMDRWAQDGRNIYLRQPGIRLNGNMVEMNTAYDKGEIRYTLDGSVPTPESALYTEAFQLPEGVKEVRARMYFGPSSWSVTSILEVDQQ